MGFAASITRIFRGIDPDNDTTQGREIVPYTDDPEARRRWLASLSLDELATIVRAASNARVIAEGDLHRAQMACDDKMQAEAEAKDEFRRECVRRNLA